MIYYISNESSTYKPFKTRKQIRKEKYGVDEDADEILLDRVAIPRRKDHERYWFGKHVANCTVQFMSVIGAVDKNITEIEIFKPFQRGPC